MLGMGLSMVSCSNYCLTSFPNSEYNLNKSPSLATHQLQMISKIYKAAFLENNSRKKGPGIRQTKDIPIFLSHRKYERNIET